VPLADPPRDQLHVLRAEIENQDGSLGGIGAFHERARPLDRVGLAASQSRRRPKRQSTTPPPPREPERPPALDICRENPANQVDETNPFSRTPTGRSTSMPKIPLRPGSAGGELRPGGGRCDYHCSARSAKLGIAPRRTGRRFSHPQGDLLFPTPCFSGRGPLIMVVVDRREIPTPTDWSRPGGAGSIVRRLGPPHAHA